MDSKQLIRAIAELIFPIVKLASVKKIGTDLREAADTSILALWDRVKPLFIEEIEELREEPEDTDVQEDVKGKVRSKLRNAAKINPKLKQELEQLLVAIQFQNGIEKASTIG